MFRPGLEEPVQQHRFKQEEEVETRQKTKNPRASDEDYIEYEEVE